jgi:hypothetical protein
MAKKYFIVSFFISLITGEMEWTSFPMLIGYLYFSFCQSPVYFSWDYSGK